MIWNRDVETMPRAKLSALQLDRLRWSVRWAYDRVAFHKHRLDAPTSIQAASARSMTSAAFRSWSRRTCASPTLPYRTVPRSEGKAVRVVDSR